MRQLVTCSWCMTVNIEYITTCFSDVEGPLEDKQKYFEPRQLKQFNKFRLQTDGTKIYGCTSALRPVHYSSYIAP